MARPAKKTRAPVIARKLPGQWELHNPPCTARKPSSTRGLSFPKQKLRACTQPRRSSSVALSRNEQPRDDHANDLELKPQFGHRALRLHAAIGLGNCCNMLCTPSLLTQSRRFPPPRIVEHILGYEQLAGYCFIDHRHGASAEEGARSCRSPPSAGECEALAGTVVRPTRAVDHKNTRCIDLQGSSVRSFAAQVSLAPCAAVIGPCPPLYPPQLTRIAPFMFRIAASN